MEPSFEAPALSDLRGPKQDEHLDIMVISEVIVSPRLWRVIARSAWKPNPVLFGGVFFGSALLGSERLGKLGWGGGVVGSMWLTQQEPWVMTPLLIHGGGSPFQCGFIAFGGGTTPYRKRVRSS